MSEALLDERLAIVVYRLMLLSYIGCAAACVVVVVVAYGTCRVFKKLSALFAVPFNIRVINRTRSAREVPESALDKPHTAGVRSRVAAEAGGVVKQSEEPRLFESPRLLRRSERLRDLTSHS